MIEDTFPPTFCVVFSPTSLLVFPPLVGPPQEIRIVIDMFYVGILNVQVTLNENDDLVYDKPKSDEPNGELWGYLYFHILTC